MKFHDSLCGAVLLTLAIFIFAYALTIPPMPGQQYGADVFPRLVAIGLGAFSLMLIWRGWKSTPAATPWIEVAEWARDARRRGNFILAFVLTIGYVLLDDVVGFIPLGIVILMVLFVRQKVDWRKGAVIAVAMVLLTQFLFGNMLRVPLPRGILTGFW